MLNQSIADVLAGKQIREVLAVTSLATVAEAVAQMSTRSVGAIVVRSGSGPIEGIFTERDLLHRVVGAGLDPRATPIAAVMSSEVRAVPSTTTVEEALRMMVEFRYRHLLVQDGERVAGLVSIRDLMFSQIMAGDTPPHEGRPGVLRARTVETLRAVQGLERGGPT